MKKRPRITHNGSLFEITKLTVRVPFDNVIRVIIKRNNEKIFDSWEGNNTLLILKADQEYGVRLVIRPDKSKKARRETIEGMLKLNSLTGIVELLLKWPKKKQWLQKARIECIITEKFSSLVNVRVSFKDSPM